MPNKLWVPGEELKAADVNQYLQNQTVMTFADSASRSAAIPTPTVGMVSYLTGTGVFEVYTDKVTPAGWRPPWNTAWGQTLSVIVSDQTIGNAPFFIIAQPMPVNIPGRQFKVEVQMIIWARTVPCTTFFEFYNGCTFIGPSFRAACEQNWNRPIYVTHVIAGSASNNIGLRVYSDGGGVNVSWGRHRIYDVGGF